MRLLAALAVDGHGAAIVPATAVPPFSAGRLRRRPGPRARRHASSPSPTSAGRRRARRRGPCSTCCAPCSRRTQRAGRPPRHRGLPARPPRPVTATASSPRLRRSLPIAAVGVAAGFLAGLFGVGGGILIVPGLVLAAGMDQRLRPRHVTGRGAADLDRLVHHLRRPTATSTGRSPLCLSIGAVAGAVVGTQAACTSCRSARCRSCSPPSCSSSAVRLFIGDRRRRPGSAHRARRRGDAASSASSPASSPACSASAAAIVMVPAMILLFGITPVVAKGTSAAVDHPRRGDGHVAQPRDAATPTCGRRRSSGRPASSPRRSAASLADQMSDELSNVLFAVLLHRRDGAAAVAAAS